MAYGENVGGADKGRTWGETSTTTNGEKLLLLLLNGEKMGSVGMTLVIGDQSGDRAGELGGSPLDGEYGLLRERRVRDVTRAVAEPFNPKEERREGSVLGGG